MIRSLSSRMRSATCSESCSLLLWVSAMACSFSSRGNNETRSGFAFRPGARPPSLQLLHDVGVAQEAARDPTRARLRQVVGPDDALGSGKLADASGDVLADRADELDRKSVVQGKKCRSRW